MAEQLTYAPFPAFSSWSTSLYEPSAFDDFAQLFRDTKEQTTAEQISRAVHTATRTAAIDTAAIEGLYDVDRGFTVSVATETASWQAALEAKGPKAQRALEDALATYEYVFDLATKREETSEAAIRHLHATICRSQETYPVKTAAGMQEHPLPKGEYKRYPNNPMSTSTGKIHHYAPVDDTPDEMHRLVKQLGSADFQAAHPVVQAAYAHYAFVCIHPFADGNGRVARAIASIYLYRDPGIPLVIYSDQKAVYLDALEAADEGQHEQFINFVGERAIDTLTTVRLAVRRSPARSAAESLAAYKSLQVGSHGLNHAEVDALLERLKTQIVQEFQKQLDALQLNTVGMSYSVKSDSGSNATLSDDYRRVERVASMSLGFVGAPPASVNLRLPISFGIIKYGREGADLIATTPSEVLEVRIGDIYPQASQVLAIKIREWVEGIIDMQLERITSSTEDKLRALGYL